MIPRILARFSSDERGAVLAIVALVSVVLVGMAALAVDLGMLYTARSEAQRAADAAALAGAQEFRDKSPDAAERPAEVSARSFAGRNTIRKVAIDPTPPEVTVKVDKNKQTVRVEITRKVETLFARVFGIKEVPVRAVAVAEAADAGAARCVKPFAIPDMWAQSKVVGKDTVEQVGKIPDSNYNSKLDRYKRHDGNLDPCTTNGGDLTGYGSCYRDATRDFGRQLKVKLTKPDGDQLQPNFFFAIQVGEDDRGGNDFRNAIGTCHPGKVAVGDTMQIETGKMTGPTFQGMKALVDQDPDAFWDGDKVSRSNSPNWMDSPRVVAIALFDPGSFGDGKKKNQKQFTVNNIALMFIEDQKSNQDEVTARFLYFAKGQGGPAGSGTGTLVKNLRLIK